MHIAGKLYLWEEVDRDHSIIGHLYISDYITLLLIESFSSFIKGNLQLTIAPLSNLCHHLIARILLLKSLINLLFRANQFDAFTIIDKTASRVSASTFGSTIRKLL